MSSTPHLGKDAMSAISSGAATAGVLSSSADATDTAEVTRLQQELHQCQEKFASWKEKAKAGVDQMRGQIVDLTRKLDESTKQCALLAAAAHHTEKLPAPYVAQSQDFMYAHAIAAACLLVDMALLAHSGGSAGQCMSTAAAAACSATKERLPNVTPESLQKTIKDQSDRLKEAHHALKRSKNELQQRNEVLRQQDERLVELKCCIADLEGSNTALKQQLMSVPNTEEWRKAHEELDQQLARAQLDYERRESQLVLQHSAEVQALKASHEREVQEMQREQQEAVAQAIRDTLSSGAQTLTRNGACSSGEREVAAGDTRRCRGDDDAYMNLLRDYEALETQCAAVMKERDTMVAQQQTFLRELRDLLHCTAGPRPVPATDGSPAITSMATKEIPASVGWDSLADSSSLKDAARHIQEQRLRFTRLHDELIRTQHELIRLRRLRSAPPEEGLGAQQLQYLRSVVVQLLCSLSDLRVVRRLLPVLGTLLKFTDADLKSVAKAIPHDLGTRWGTDDPK
ncbi:hypothetical protein LSCM1_02440 [Leishmania martiniquensis]|uniref:GRIP domain-containing protein n=1 Tax=Leishmania martiniquensis TaxID=1580590 RepID=A0A836H156_9TRYP|nr:hypothetical protein LSCM1_02440 [Leishmania martiniquensis]